MLGGHPTGSGSTPAEGGEVGLPNIKLVELCGLYCAVTPPIGGGNNKVVSIVLIYVLDEWIVVHWKNLVLDRETHPAGGSHMTDFDVTLIVAEPEG